MLVRLKGSQHRMQDPGGCGHDHGTMRRLTGSDDPTDSKPPSYRSRNAGQVERDRRVDLAARQRER